MKKEGTRGLVRWYLRQHGTGLCLLVVCSVVYGTVFYLYNVSVEPVVYGGILCVFLMLGIYIWQFVKFYREHQKRKDLLKSIEYAYNDLPEADTLAEKDYQRMIERLGELCQKQLMEWEQSQQASKDYYTMWVHQIKTPIAAMRMILQEEDTQTNLDLRAELFRVEQYVEMVLSYIRLESSESDFVFRTCRLDDVIRQAIHKYASQFIRKKLRLVYEPTDVEVLTDEKWLLFILEQLLSNAVKYTQTGTITIEVSDDKKLMVRDTGIGIAAEDLPRIFEKGFTGYNGRNDKKATGLGLNLCRKTADKLGIRIAAESEAGKGSCFTLDLKERQIDIE